VRVSSFVNLTETELEPCKEAPEDLEIAEQVKAEA
jgi:hypothetical protein